MKIHGRRTELIITKILGHFTRCFWQPTRRLLKQARRVNTVRETMLRGALSSCYDGDAGRPLFNPETANDITGEIIP